MDAETEKPSEKGLTWRVIITIIYAAIVFQPVAIWLEWVSGVVIALAIEYTVLLFASTLADFSGKPLSRQEAFIIYATTGTVVLESIFAKIFIYNYYKSRYSPAAHAFGLTKVIPNWFVPPVGINTLVDTSWIIPVLLWVFFFGVLSKVADVSLGYMFHRVYLVEEKLPFPSQRVWAAACITVAEKAKMPKQLKIFTLSAIMGIVYGSILYGFPYVLGMSVLPIPWIDWTGTIEHFLPGASMGIATDLAILTFGFVIPWSVIVSMFIGAIAIYIIGNHLAVTFGWGGAFDWWSPGMDLGSIRWQSQLRVWASPMIGVSIAAGVVPLFLGRKYIVRAFKRRSGLREASEKRGAMPTWLPFALFIVAASGSVVISYILCPDFPLWAFIALALGWTFLANIISGRALGETGLEFNVPYVREGSYLALGYQGVNAWFAPIYTGATGVGWIGGFAGATFTGTSKRDYIMAYVLAVPLAYIVSFIAVQAFWSIAPIPSEVYPMTAVDWPVRSMWELLWIKRPLSILSPFLILISFAIGFIAALSCSIFKVPFVLIAFGIGMGQLIPFTVSTFIGGVIGQLLMRKLGKEWWDEYKAVIVAGIGLGEGVVVAISAAIMLIMKAMWISPI